MLINGRDYVVRPPASFLRRGGARRGDDLAAPPDRFIQRPYRPLLSERFERYESTTAEVTSGDTDAIVIRFSGYPDSIVLHSRTFGALFTLCDFLQRAEDPIIVHQDAQVETHISRPIVKVRNLVAGSNAVVFVTGKWATRREAD
jgi:hypothetical protein